jgi:hypothetical protein
MSYPLIRRSSLTAELVISIAQDWATRVSRGWIVMVVLGGLCGAHAQGPREGGSEQPTIERSAVLQSDQVSLLFDRPTGTLRAIENKLTGETYRVEGDEFGIEAVGFRVGFAEAKLVGLAVEGSLLTADYRAGSFTIQVRYVLRGHFVEKQMTLTSARDYGLKKLTVSQPRFAGAELTMLAYRYPKYGRQPGQEPCCTYFLRSSRGGFFAGTEVPFDVSSVGAAQVTLAYPPSLKVKAQEPLESEPVYIGVYRKPPDEDAPPNLPLRSESDAMVAMTSTILGPPRFGLVPMACGWPSQMEHRAYTEQSLAADMQSLDFLASCGIDWVTDSHPWGGETEKMNALGKDDVYAPGPMVRKFLQHAREVGVKIVMWGSMNNTHPWEGGKPFRADKPEWLFVPGPATPRSCMNPSVFAEGNCIANRDFFNWIARVNLEGLATKYYEGWAMDGDFFGGGGLYTTVVRVDCESDKHDHLSGDATYASQRALGQLFDSVRRHGRSTYVLTCRPAMDLGVWMMRNVDASFTMVETGTGSASNLVAGDQIRAASRARVHYEFLPHYLDQPLLFPSWAGTESVKWDAGQYSDLLPLAFPIWDGKGKPPVWPRGHLDYLLLSGMSSSPNQMYQMPTKTGIPDEDRTEIRQWLDWGRKNAEYLRVRKDLPDWPAPGKVDGSAHIVGGSGFVFLFNSSKDSLKAGFTLSAESIGLAGGSAYRVSQYYPAAEHMVTARYGDPIRWDVPAETVLILEILPVGQERKE